jgi:uncharacterized phage protein (TIGR01671 family)
MREIKEIKFRGWDGENMHHEGFCDYLSGHGCMFNYDIKSLMQFTGLQDVNGVDIYEGDIVCIEKDKFGIGRHEVWSIEYGYFGDAAFYVQNNINSGRLIEVDQYHPHFSPDGSIEITLEVTGNIYQNPELLK